MRQLAIVALVVLARLGLQAQTGPSITGVSGTVAHGQPVVISGSGFGTKPTAAPVKYDDFQSLTTGQVLSASGWTVGGLYKPVAATATLRPGTPFVRNARAHFNGRMPFSQEADASNFYLTGKNFTKAYIDFWMYADSRAIGSAKPQNIKIFRLHQTSTGNPNAYFSTTVTPGSGGDSLCAARDGTATTEWPGCAPSTVANNGGIPNNEFPGTEFWDKWHHFQVQTAAGTDNNSNGTWILYIDGKLRYNRPGNIQMMRSGFNRWMEVYFGNYVRSEEWDGDAYFNWEAVYVDDSWAHVEIGDAPTYAASRHREIQIPTAWSASSVSAKVNAGSFPAGATAYLFVVDANGTPSAGRAVTIGSGSQPPACVTAPDVTAITYTAAGGSKAVNVSAAPATCPWTTSESLTWVSVDVASGTGPGAVVVTADPNPGTLARSASVTVAGQAIAIAQPGTAVVPPAGQTVFCWKQDTSVTPPVMVAVPCTP